MVIDTQRDHLCLHLCQPLAQHVDCGGQRFVCSNVLRWWIDYRCYSGGALIILSKFFNDQIRLPHWSLWSESLTAAGIRLMRADSRFFHSVRVKSLLVEGLEGFLGVGKTRMAFYRPSLRFPPTSLSASHQYRLICEWAHVFNFS